jgi:RHS repeat-associated protein
VSAPRGRAAALLAFVVTLAVGMLGNGVTTARAQAPYIVASSVPASPSAQPQAPFSVSYEGWSGWTRYWIDEYDYWDEYWYDDVDPWSLGVTVSGRQSMSMLHSDNNDFMDCQQDWNYDYNQPSGETCHHTGSFSGTLSWATGTPATIVATIGGTYGPYTTPAQVVNPNIDVTPDARSVVRAAGGWYTETFTLTNPTTVGNTFTVSTTCTGAAGSCPVPGSVYVGAGASMQFNVSYQAAPYSTANPLGAGRITFHASTGAYNDSGTVTIQSVGVVSLQTAFTGPDLDRGNCLTLAAGENAAFQCGALRVVHALPTVRTNGKARALTLLWERMAASGTRITPAHVRIPADVATPTRVTADIYVAPLGLPLTTKYVQGQWAGANFTPGSTRRIAFGYNGDPTNPTALANGDAEGAYAYRVLLHFWHGTDPGPEYASDTGTYVNVNRRQSPYGAGWWPAGLEHLVIPSVGDLSVRAWIGGDGSTRLYRPTGAANVWRAGALDRPDSLTYDPATGQYTRWDAHRLQVRFDGYGRHVATVTRTNDVTQFDYDPSMPARLSAVHVPKLANAYTFTWTPGGVPGFDVTSVGRTTKLRFASSSATASIVTAQDPDGRTTSFGYGGTAMSSRTGRSGIVQTFTVFKVTLTNPGVPGTGSITPFIITQPAEWWGQPPSPGGLGTSSNPDSLITYFTGARSSSGAMDADALNDWTRVFVDRFGAPVRVENYQNATVIERGDARFPALVTKTTAPSGVVASASYDDHGNLKSSTMLNPYNDGRNATTTYEWDLRWDFPLSVVQPEGERTDFLIDWASGNRIYQQDTRGQSSRTSFYYDGAQVAIVEQPGTFCAYAAYTWSAGCETYARDGLGNLTEARSAVGYRTTYDNDALGRPWRVRAQVDTANTTKWQDEIATYNVMDADTLHISASSYEGQTLSVLHIPDSRGRDSAVARWSSPDPTSIGTITTQYIRDGFGRVVQEIAPDSAIDSLRYDYASNVIYRRTRRLDTLSYRFDGLNRMTRRGMSAVAYPVEAIGLARASAAQAILNSGAATSADSLVGTYPFGMASGLSLPATGDDFVFRASDGALSDANNADARVHREYFPNGQLASETTTIRNWNDGTFSHSYTTSYAYDRDGRRSSTTYPSQLAAGTSGTVTFTYTGFGTLANVTDMLGHTVTQWFDDRSQLTARDLGGAATQTFQYYQDGALSRDALDVDGARKRDEFFQYDARGKLILDTETQVSGGAQSSMVYNGLGQLTSNQQVAQGQVRNSIYTPDAFGNVRLQHGVEGHVWAGGSSGTTEPDSYNFYQVGTGRQWLISTIATADLNIQPSPVISTFDAAGNLTWNGRYAVVVSGNRVRDPQVERRLYYNANNVMVAVDARQFSGGLTQAWSRTFDQYRYDALGRRVVVRTNKSCAGMTDVTGPTTSRERVDCLPGGIRRTIWDGSAELGEIQQPDGVGYDLESDTFSAQTLYGSGVKNLAPFYGTVTYVYDERLDKPVSVMRSRYTNLILSNGYYSPVVLAPFTFYPVWNVHGQADQIAKTTPTPECPLVGTAPGGVPTASCIHYVRNSQWLAYMHLMSGMGAWQGTLIEDKQGAGGTNYRRNRYYDSNTGRFTQEDPIGLAGGVNLYGFAGGDPVSYSDPFGLCPPRDKNTSDCAWMHEEGLQSGGWADPIAWLSGGVAVGIERGLAMLGGKAVTNAGARVAANKVAGDAFRDEIASAFENNGYEVAKEVGKKTPFGRRVIDVEVSKNGEVLGGIEAKAGKSRYLPWQMAKDEYLRRTGYPVQLVRDATAVKVSGLP